MSLTVNGIEPSAIIVKKINKQTKEEISSTELNTVVCNEKEVWSAVNWVGETSDNLVYSKDGVSWYFASIEPSTYGYTDFNADGGIYYGNGMWIACSTNINNESLYSKDGKEWKRLVTLINKSLKGGARYANGIWVAGTENYGIMYSYDGIIWRPSNLTQGSFTWGIRYGNGIWVACAYDRDGGLFWSEDGINWTQSDASYNIDCVGGARYANGIWVACPAYANIMYSYDGKHWTFTEGDTSEMVGGARYGNGVWVACAPTKRMQWSEDGIHWQEVGYSPYNPQESLLPDFYLGARYANGIWVACSRVKTASKGNGIWYSYNGMTWYQSRSFRTSYFRGGAIHKNGRWSCCSATSSVKFATTLTPDASWDNIQELSPYMSVYAKLSTEELMNSQD